MSEINTVSTTKTRASKALSFSKILIAVDGSKPSFDALDSAISMARLYNAKLIALYVILSDSEFAYGSTSDYEIIPTLDEFSRHFGKGAKDELQSIFDKINSEAKENNIEIATELVASPNIVRGIIGYAENGDIDLIVVGTRGRTGFKKLLLGSVASGVVTYAHCPVLVTK
jgi:nucleotide-binding universal stress UspA family protein